MTRLLSISKSWGNGNVAKRQDVKTDSGVSIDDAIERVKFPEVDHNRLEPTDILRLLVGSYRGLRGFYEKVLASSRGEAKTVVRLLRNDWRVQTESLLSAGEDLLVELADGDETVTIPSCPRDDDVKTLARSLKGSDVEVLLESIEAVAERCLVGTRMLPLGKTEESVELFFRACVEAEDQHLAQMIWLRETIVASES